MADFETDTTSPLSPQSDEERSLTLQPSDPFQGYDLEQRMVLGAEVDRDYESWRTPRRQHELQWFINAAYRRGKHTSEALHTGLDSLTTVNRRRKNIANKLWAKARARFAKFVKTRPKPIVVPFTHERKDRLDARMTERALDYLYERDEQEQKYIDVVQWAGDTGKAYWCLHWNPKRTATVQIENPILQTKQMVDSEEGDIETEVESAFGILVPDLRLAHLWEQPKVMRVRVLEVNEARSRYPEFADRIKADSHLGSPFEFERQIAHLSGNEAGALASMHSDTKGEHKGVLVKEEYWKPNAKFPKGRQIVSMNKFAVKVVDELPHRFYDMVNPYPFVEFADMPSVGQFYTTTFIEHLIPLQRGYNMLRDKLETQIRMNVHPKWLVARQARISKGALTNEAGEVVEWNYIPGMPEPRPVTPGNIVSDAWRFAQLLKEEFDDISQVYPSFEGKAGTAKSGFQTNLLQEASDNVHSPDARGFELAIKDAAYKFRRMMKDGYDVKRLLSFAGRNSIPEVFEFSSENIDEHATIRVQIGSGLSTFKAARVQQLLDLHEKGLLGDPNDPEVKRKVLAILDLGGVEEFQEKAARDEDMARMENIDILAGQEVPVPQFYEDHMVHYSVHTDELKSPANKQLPPEMRRALVGHVLLHMKWINEPAAYQLAMEQGFNQLIRPGLINPPDPMQQMGQSASPAPQASPSPTPMGHTTPQGV